MSTLRLALVLILTVVTASASPAWAGGRWRSRQAASPAARNDSKPGDSTGNNGASFDARSDAAISARQNAIREQNARANALYPKWNGGFHSRFYTEYGWPSGTYGLRGLPW